MNSNKTFIILVVSAAFLLGAGILLFVFRGGGDTPSGSSGPGSSFPWQNTTPVGVLTPDQQADIATKIEVTNRQGRVMQVNNFKDDTEVKEDPLNPGHYLMGVGVPSGTTDADPFSIAYIETDQTFTIALMKEPLSETRRSAEEYLKTKLGLLNRQMCQLKYFVSTPYWVNQAYSGTNLGFSFCPDAVALP